MHVVHQLAELVEDQNAAPVQEEEIIVVSTSSMNPKEVVKIINLPVPSIGLKIKKPL